MNFNGNTSHGLSAGSLKISDSTVSANGNGGNGIHVTAGITSVKSDITIENNQCAISSQWTIPGALYIDKGESSIAESTVRIQNNKGSGLYQKAGTLTVQEGTDFSVQNNQAELLKYGGGIYSNGVLVLPSDAKIYNNHAVTGGDDIYNTGTITFGPVGSDWELDDCGHLIDGWYIDEAGHRWSAHKRPVYAEKMELSEGEEVFHLEGGVTALKAAHALQPLEPGDPDQPNWEVSKSKTATNLDKNFESEVTLSLPAAEERLESDVVFVLDKSSCSKNVTTNALEMLKELNNSAKESGAVINVAAVQFAGRATVSCDWTRLTDEATAEGGAIYEGLKEKRFSSGTNLQAGLLKAQELLDADTDVVDDRKYVVVITDGLTRQFLADDGTTLMTVYNAFESDGTRIWGNPSGWCAANGFEDGTFSIPGGDWDTYFATVKANVIKDGNQYAHNYEQYGDQADTNPPPSYVPVGGTSLEYALCMDRAIFEAERVYRELESNNYHCYTVFTEDTPQVTKNELGQAFIKALNNGKTLDFDDIHDDIYYLLDKGSQVVDVIGSGTDNKGNAYNFDFVDDINKLTLTVGGVEQNKTELIDPGYTLYVTSAYGFGTPDADGKYPYVLRYYADGQDGESDECFVWEINVPVSNFEPVELTYSVKLTNPQSEPGTYGVYQPNGGKEETGLLTNKSAVLSPVDSNGEAGVPESFAKPTVSYTVAGEEESSEPEESYPPRPDPDPSDPDEEIPDESTPTTSGPDGEVVPEGPGGDGEEIPDESTPLTSVPTEDIDDEETPVTAPPKTGSAATSASLILAAASALGLVLIRKKK